MGNKSFSWDDLKALNLATGEVDAAKKKANIEARDRKIADEEKKSFERHRNSNSSGDHRGYGRNNNGNGQDGKYVGAPYNFVPLWNKVAKPDRNERISHSSTDKGLLSGEIRYSITARTPIMVSDGKKGNEQFIKNPYGQYAIPGSSICGLIRSNAQILSQSSLADDIDDYFMMYREVGGANGHSMNKEAYDGLLGSDTISVNGRSFSILKNVKAGYIENTGSGYHIFHVKPDKINDQLAEMNYYVLSERFVFEQLDSGRKEFEYLKRIQLQHKYDGYEFKKYDDENGHTHYVCISKDSSSQNKFMAMIKALDEYADVKTTNDSDKMRIEKRDNLNKAKREVRDTLNLAFEPGSYPISYMLANDRVIAIGDERKYEKKGYLLISGIMQEKKALYIIPEIDKEKEPIAIDDKDARAYQIDYENKKNQLKKPKSFWALPKRGEIKPVFYINLERLYFGFTPHLRLFYKESIHNGLGGKHKPGEYDYAKSLFGYSNDEDSYKSRVSFSDATVEGQASPMGEQIITLGGPKPSSYSDYLNVDEEGNSYTYNNEDYRIRGVKQYWLRDNVVNQNKDYELADERKRKQIDNVSSKIHPLPPGTKFQGKVRFHNLRKEELGLLLWSLRLEEDSEMNIGKGKPYGYGRIKLDIQDVEKLDTEQAYSTTALILHPMKEIMPEVDGMIDAYKVELSAMLGLKDSADLDKLPAIAGLMKMKNGTKLPDPKKIRYMNINKKEYQNRRPLKGIDDTLT